MLPHVAKNSCTGSGYLSSCVDSDSSRSWPRLRRFPWPPSWRRTTPGSARSNAPTRNRFSPCSNNIASAAIRPRSTRATSTSSASPRSPRCCSNRRPGKLSSSNSRWAKCRRRKSPNRRRPTASSCSPGSTVRLTKQPRPAPATPAPSCSGGSPTRNTPTPSAT